MDVGGDNEMRARIAAQREKVLDELKALDALYVEAGYYPPREPAEMMTHVLVLSSWHRMGDTDSVAITDYRLTPMATWIAAGLARAGTNFLEAEYMTGGE